MNFPKLMQPPPPPLFPSKLGKNQDHINSVAGNEGTDRQTDKKRKVTEDLLKLGKMYIVNPMHSNWTILTPFHSHLPAEIKITETLCVFSNIKQITWLVNKST